MLHQLVGRPIAIAKLGFGYDSRILEIIEAIRAGEIEGDIYSDGEVWADSQSLTGFLARQIPA